MLKLNHVVPYSATPRYYMFQLLRKTDQKNPSGSPLYSAVKKKRKKKVTSACGAASPPSRPGCAERCPAVPQLGSPFPLETTMVDCTSAPSTTPPFDAENQDLPLHGEEMGNVIEELYYTYELTSVPLLCYRYEKMQVYEL